MIFLILLGIAGGVFTFLQTTINSRLRGHVESPYLSSFISFAIGTVLLSVICIGGGGQLIPTAAQNEMIPWWAYLGGFVGMIVMTVYILLFPILGGVQTVAMPIFGQIIMSVLVDNFGWFGAQKRAMGIWNVIGVLILIVGVFTVVMLPDIRESKGKQNAGDKKKNKWIWQIVAVMAGMILAIQVAVNGYLGQQLHSPMQSAAISLGIGLIILFVINVCQRSWKNLALLKKKKAPVWTYIGGVFGAIYIFLNAYLAPQLGTGTVVVFALVGQMISSLIIDNFGLLGAVRRKVTGIQISGLVIMLVGVTVIKLM